MNKVSKIVVSIIAIIVVIAFVILILINWNYHSPIVSFDSGSFFQYEEEYNRIANACYNNYLQAHQDNEEITRLVYSGKRGNSDYLFCCSDDKYHLYLSEEECDAIDKIYDTFHINTLRSKIPMLCQLFYIDIFIITHITTYECRLFIIGRIN